MLRIIEIEANELGGHDNLTVYTDDNYPVPEDWLIIPDDIEIPETFPFVSFHYRAGKVIDMTAGIMPEPEPEPSSEPEPETDVWAEMANAIKTGVNSID